MQKRHRGIEDPEQGWILGELIRYLQHPSSGAMLFDDMGPSWVAVREAVREGSLTRRDPGVLEVASRWIQLIRYSALRFGANIGEEVQPLWTKRRDVDASKHASELAAELTQAGQLDGGLRVPNTAGDTFIVADIKAKQLTASIEVEAPHDRGARSRVTWLINQVAAAPPKTIIEAWPKNARVPVATGSLADVRENRSLLCPDNKEPARFRLLLRGEMGLARKSGSKTVGFIDSISKLLDDFYVGVVQNLKPWRPPAPRMPTAAERSSDEAAGPSESISAEVLHELGASVAPDPPSPPTPDEPLPPYAVPIGPRGERQQVGQTSDSADSPP
jgi:hypothetical protein